jgi:conjugative relaxase-like TrwC/TraI family protein
MITTPTNSSARAASKYYYETQEHSAQWYGKLAEKFGLNGKNCTQAQFQAMILGYDPRDLKTALFKNAGEPDRRAGADYTFTLAKNASILALYDDRILKAFEESVKETINIMEERYAATRTRISPNERIVEKTGNLIATIFTHYASRNLDPAVHFHVFFHNATEDIKRILKSVEFREMFANKAYMGAIQENIFVQKVMNLGYETEYNRAKAMADIKMPENLKELKELFSSRQQQIDVKVAELRKKYPNMSEKDLRQLAEKATRSVKEHNPTYKETKEFVEKKITPEQLNNIKEMVKSVQEWQSLKTAAETKEFKAQTSFDRYGITKDAVRQAHIDITENYRAFKYEKIENFAIKHGFAKTDISAIRSAVKADKQIVEIDKKYFTTKEVLRDIKQNYQTFLRNAHSDASFNSIDIDKAIETYEEGFGKKLTESQTSMVKNSLSSNFKYNVVQGDAGVGKSKALEVINNFLKEKGYKVIGLAPTGKAAEVLRNSSSFENVYTIAKFKDLIKSGKLELEVDKKTFIFADEASMISDKQAKFLNSLDVEKLVYTGDKKQFPSIERGDFFKEAQKAALESRLPNVFTNMDIAVRFKSETQKRIVEAILTKYSEGFDLVRSTGNLKVFSTGSGSGIDELAAMDAKIQALKNDYLSDVEKNKNVLILVDTNHERNALNSVIRQELVERGIVQEGQSFNIYENKYISIENKGFAEAYEAGDKVFISVKDRTLYTVKEIDQDKNILKLEGENGLEKDFKLTNKNKTDVQAFIEKDINLAENDKIVFLKNNTELGVQNGEVGTIKSVADNQITIQKANNDIVTIDAAAYKYLDHAYALTVYKSQGETIDISNYLLNMRISDNFEEKFYTAGTRATEEFKIWGTDKEVELFQENLEHAEEVRDYKEELNKRILEEALNLPDETETETEAQRQETEQEIQQEQIQRQERQEQAQQMAH